MVNIEEGLDHENLLATILKYLSDHRKCKYELVYEQKNNLTLFFSTKNYQSK